MDAAEKKASRRGAECESRGYRKHVRMREVKVSFFLWSGLTFISIQHKLGWTNSLLAPCPALTTQ